MARSARQVDGAGQAHQHPAAHVRGAGRKRRHEAAQAACAQDVVGKVLGAEVADAADAEHGDQLDGEHDRRWVVSVELLGVSYAYVVPVGFYGALARDQLRRPLAFHAMVISCALPPAAAVLVLMACSWHSAARS